MPNEGRVVITGLESKPYDMDGNQGESYKLALEFGGIAFKVKLSPKDGNDSLLKILKEDIEAGKNVVKPLKI